MAALAPLDTRALPWLREARQALPALRARGVHAVLLHGAVGIGKKRLALNAAGALLCETPATDGNACGLCPGCRLYAAGSHPDLRVVVPDTLAALRPAPTPEADEEGEDGLAEAAEEPSEERKEKRVSREIRIDQVRDLLDFANLATHRAGLRVVVVAPAEALNAPAANALLKLLEEPAAGTVFLLVSDALDRVLPTIRSRCVLVRVAAPDWAQAVDWLRGQGVADAAGALAAAGGQPIAALERAQADPADGALRASLLELLAAGGRLPAETVVARLPRTLDWGATLTLLQRWGWDLLAQRLAGRVRYHPEHARRLEELAGGVRVPALLGWLGTLRRQQATADHPVNARLAAEAALLEYCSLWNTSMVQR